jgi:hypothetical protein
MMTIESTFLMQKVAQVELRPVFFSKMMVIWTFLFPISPEKTTSGEDTK